MNKIEIKLPIYTLKEESSVAKGMARLCRCEMCPIGSFDCPFTEQGKMDRDVCHKIQAHQWKRLIEENKNG